MLPTHVRDLGVSIDRIRTYGLCSNSALTLNIMRHINKQGLYMERYKDPCCQQMCRFKPTVNVSTNKCNILYVSKPDVSYVSEP